MRVTAEEFVELTITPGERGKEVREIVRWILASLPLTPKG